jgi:hypothetical protein
VVRALGLAQWDAVSAELLDRDAPLGEQLE